MRHARAFRTCCGSALPFASDDLVVVPAGSLDAPLVIAPQAHLFLSRRAEWDQGLGDLPGFEGLPPAPEASA